MSEVPLYRVGSARVLTLHMGRRGLWESFLAFRSLFGRASRQGIQGYLALKKQPPPRQGGAVSYERGTPVHVGCGPSRIEEPTPHGRDVCTPAECGYLGSKGT